MFEDQDSFESQFSVSFDEQEIKLKTSTGRVLTLAWSELVGIGIETTDEGPLMPDVFWVLGAAQGSLRFPQGAQGEGELLSRLQQLPDFDNQAVIQSMISTENKFFVCWQKQVPE